MTSFCGIITDEPKKQSSVSTNRKATNDDKTSQQSFSSDVATHGSAYSSMKGGSKEANTSGCRRGKYSSTSCNNGQSSAWAIERWLEQTPRDEPWIPGGGRRS